MYFGGILHVIDHTSSALLYALAIDGKMFLCFKNPFFKFFSEMKASHFL